MGKTANLNLNTCPSSEWGSTKYGDFIKALAGTDATSNMQILDAVIAALQSDKADLVDGLVPISQLPSSVKEGRIVDTIADRDSISDVFTTLRVYVKDASGDATVSSGGAEYLYDGSGWIKTSEEESLDLVLSWANVTGKPDVFTPAAHQHGQEDIDGLSTALASKMDTSVYDPNHKAQDIFAYVDDQINNAIGAALGGSY